MLLDMTPPYGQYGQTKTRPGLNDKGEVVPPPIGQPNSPHLFPLSIFNAANQLPDKDNLPVSHWQNPVFFDPANPTTLSHFRYVNESGEEDYVEITEISAGRSSAPVWHNSLSCCSIV